MSKNCILCNLFFFAADVWRVHRKKLTPSFHFDILRDSLNIIRTNAKILCNQMKAEMERPEFDIMEYIEKCSLDIIGGKS